MRKYLLLLSFACFLLSKQAWAKKDIYQSAAFINGAAWNAMPVTFSNQVPSPPVVSFGGVNMLHYRTKTLNSYVKFWLRTEHIPTGIGSFSALATLQIVYYPEDPNGNLQAGIAVNKTLTINYDAGAGIKYKNIDIASFPGAAKITVTIVSLQVNGVSATPSQQSFIALQSFIEHERYYNYQNIFGGIVTMPILPAPTASYIAADNEVTISWNAERFAEGYELEYTFVDDYGNNGYNINFISPNQLNFSFRNNSTRILTEKTSYTMPLIQEHGYIVFRVRGYGMAGAGFDRIFFGSYNAAVDGNQIFTVSAYPYKYQVTGNILHVGDKINWQSVTTFAEEGKSKTVVKYMDGSMRMRQTVTSTSTEREAIVAETVYDFQGRPAVNILPAPVDKPAIKYYSNFNKNMQGQPYTAADFDKLDNSGCSYNINPLQQQNNNSTGNYYSKYNPNKTAFNAFIPEADGYPFTRVTYMPDPTDRVVQQGNVGEIFQPGNTGINGTNTAIKHPTKYYYGKPNQEELDRLFGTDVGYNTFYQKNFVVDPNGQSSVSYVDLNGKTIATALAGIAPVGMDTLESNTSISLHDNLFSTADVIDNTNHSLTSSQSFLVTANGTKYHFSYDIKENIYNALSCGNKNYCLDCIYDLEIKLVNDECGTVIYKNAKTIGKLINLDFLCNNANAMDKFSFDEILNTGSYTITRKLIVNKQAAEFYAAGIINDPANNCLKTFDDFFDEAWSNRDTTRCKDACTACKDESKAAENAAAIATAVRECDSLWCNPQLPTQCDMARLSMINDLKPGGQYARYKDDNGNITFGNSPISIFYDGSFTGVNSLMLPNTVSIAAGVLNIPVTLPNNPVFPLSHYIRNSNTAPLDTLLKLINNWPDDLSEQLLPLHPEYCYLKFCSINKIQLSNEFDTKYMNALTFAGAQSLGIVNAINTFYTQDPLYQYLQSLSPTSSLVTDFQNRFTNYTGAGNSITQMAVFLVNCPSGNNINICSGAWSDGINDDDEWEKFKTIYYNIKQEFIQKAREDYVQRQGCCSNNNIGCIANNNCNIPYVWPHFPVQPPQPCSNNNWAVYGNAQKRFVTINDISFPGISNPDKSIYDMTPQELADHMKSDSLQSPCPTCPELDAFKIMIWDLANKKLFSTGGSIKPDALIGLKDSLRQRFVGSQANDDININRNGNIITISSKTCTINFTPDTTINWEKAEILPTCLEIKDYRNAKLHVMVNGEYKTVLNLTSTCDLFYCYGTPPVLPPPNNDCKCDSVYDNKATYQLGNIVSYKNICYIVKKIDKQKGLTPGYYPGMKQYWEKLCENSPTPCKDVINILFDGDQALNSDLTNVSSAIQPLTPNKYTIRNNYTISGQNISSSPNPAVILYPTLDNQLLFQTTRTVQVNKNYTLSFEALLLFFGDQSCFNLIVEVNGQTLVNENCIQARNNPWITRNGWYNYSASFNTGNTSTATIRFISGKQNVSDIIAIKNIKLSCEGATLNNGSNATGQTNSSAPTRYIPQSSCGCNNFCDVPLPSPEIEHIPCDSVLKEIANQQAAEAYNNYRDSVYNAILNGYYEHCLQSIETFNMEYNNAEYHYTLYYYDQSGNLVRTIPPAGVKPFTTQAELNTVSYRRNNPLAGTYVPAHLMQTTYQHNSLNAVVWQKTPDAGESEFYYDGLGRIALSRNAKQKPQHTASYTTYDKLGRTIEVGCIDVNGITSLKATAYNYIGWGNFVNNRNRTEITKTWYDAPVKQQINIAFGTTGQTNLRNRIATIAVFENNTDLNSFENNTNPTAIHYTHATHYNYDITGNVTDLLQDFGKYTAFGFDPNNVRLQSKHINYRFDLVSGKVNEVQYQPGYPDQFFYRYQYNADNKLTGVFTSNNNIIWENDARYKYYRHGPLARTELGTDSVQGIDMAYTLQGWIKGANGYTIAPQNDAGKDGNSSSQTPATVGYNLQNKRFAADVYGYWLSYFTDDYKAAGNSTAGINNVTQALTSGGYNSTPANLYNGNIRSMYTYLQPFTQIIGMHYKYDQLNRIKEQNAWDVDNGVSLGTNYQMKLTYDPNGNIQTLERHTGMAVPDDMDKLQYVYYTQSGTYTGNPTAADATNKLAWVKDAVGPTAEPTDIEPQAPGNYQYDAIGNLTKDVSEGINSIDWNLQNKITRITKTDTTVEYGYDPMGNRVIKMVQGNNPQQFTNIEFYVRDALGNTLAIYRRKNDSIYTKEQQLYGSSRLGVQTQDVYGLGNYFPIGKTPLLTFDLGNGVIQTAPQRPYPIESHRNNTQYELTNHLGNVLATITDSRTYNNTATLSTATDYYAFGMAIPGRTYALNSAEYKFGFNGKENDTETKTQDYGFRIYNPGLGRFLSVDPLTRDYPELTTYQFASNTPISAIDLDGKEKKDNKESNDLCIEGKMCLFVADMVRVTASSVITIATGLGIPIINAGNRIAHGDIEEGSGHTKPLIKNAVYEIDDNWNFVEMKGAGTEYTDQDISFEAGKKFLSSATNVLTLSASSKVKPMVKAGVKVFDGIIVGIDVVEESKNGNKYTATTKATTYVASESIKWAVKKSLPEENSVISKTRNKVINKTVKKGMKEYSEVFTDEARKKDIESKNTQKSGNKKGVVIAKGNY